VFFAGIWQCGLFFCVFVCFLVYFFYFGVIELSVCSFGW